MFIEGGVIADTLLLDVVSLLVNAGSGRLEWNELLNTLPIQFLLRSDQTRGQRPRQILLGEPSGPRRNAVAGREDDLRRTALVRGQTIVEPMGEVSCHRSLLGLSPGRAA